MLRKLIILSSVFIILNEHALNSVERWIEETFSFYHPASSGFL